MKKYFFAMLVIAALMLALSGCGPVTVTINPSSSPTTGNTGTDGTPHFGVQTKTSGCQALNGLPDSACTPGAILSTGIKEAICKPGYAKSVRNVPNSEKD